MVQAPEISQISAVIRSRVLDICDPADGRDFSDTDPVFSPQFGLLDSLDMLKLMLDLALHYRLTSDVQLPEDVATITEAAEWLHGILAEDPERSRR